MKSIASYSSHISYSLLSITGCKMRPEYTQNLFDLLKIVPRSIFQDGYRQISNWASQLRIILYFMLFFLSLFQNLFCLVFLRRIFLLAYSFRIIFFPTTSHSRNHVWSTFTLHISATAILLVPRFLANYFPSCSSCTRFVTWLC